MIDKKTDIPPHNDKNFSLGFTLYCAADIICKSNSWESMSEKISRFPQSDNVKSLLFKRFQAVNITILIEHQLCCLLGYLYRNNLFKSKNNARQQVIEQIKRFRKTDNKVAEQLLNEDIGNEEERIWTPHKLLFVAGYSIGNFISLLDSQTKVFIDKKELLDNLRELNLKRNLIIHNSTSSRIDIESENNLFLILSDKCLKILERYTITE